jgi:hypothetical protein
MSEEPTIPVPMTTDEIEMLRRIASVSPNSWAAMLGQLVRKCEAAVARPAEPRKGMAEGEVRCTCHGVAVSACPSCGGVVGGDA